MESVRQRGKGRENIWFPENSKEIFKDGEIFRRNAFKERLSMISEGESLKRENLKPSR